VVEWAQRHGHALKASPERVLPIATAEYPTPARRPLNSRLDTARLRQRFGLVLPAWQLGVERMLAEVLQR
jgi:dTDP-4-dehydrorhamnose reductase